MIARGSVGGVRVCGSGRGLGIVIVKWGMTGVYVCRGRNGGHGGVVGGRDGGGVGGGEGGGGVGGGEGGGGDGSGGEGASNAVPSKLMAATDSTEAPRVAPRAAGSARADAARPTAARSGRIAETPMTTEPPLKVRVTWSVVHPRAVAVLARRSARLALS